MKKPDISSAAGNATRKDVCAARIMSYMSSRSPKSRKQLPAAKSRLHRIYLHWKIQHWIIQRWKNLRRKNLRWKIQTPPERKRTEAKTNSAIEIYREIIKENIDYDILIQDPKMDKDRLDEIVEIMLETVCTARKTIRIAGDDYPAELVKSKFMKLNSSHVEFVLDCMRENTTKIRNIKQYLKAVLFNAPSTIDSYYTALVNHDFYGSK